MSPAVDDYRPFRTLRVKDTVQERFEVPTLVRVLGLPRGGRVLEVGCGRGVALGPIARLLEPRRLVGIDLDREALAAAHERLAVRGVPAELVLGDVRAMPFAAASFDVVIDFGTLYHLSRPELALGEIERVLAPGGLFVHETRIAQLAAHPVRALGRSICWSCAPALRAAGRGGLWAARCHAPKGSTR